MMSAGNVTGASFVSVLYLRACMEEDVGGFAMTETFKNHNSPAN